MSDENVPENEPEPLSASQSAVASASKVLGNTETVTSSLRLSVDAGLLGVCIVFLAAMLGVPQKQIDTPLTIALLAFAVAIPLLVYGFLFASYKAKPVSGWLVLVALQMGAWVVEGFGELAVTIGVFAVVAHLSFLAFRASIVAIILVVVLGFSGSFIGLIIYGMAQYKKQQEKAAKEGMIKDSADK